MSNTITEGIRVQVKATFWPERSNVEGGQWAFSYSITISNEGSAPATLRTRHWLITDATGSVLRIICRALPGEEPILEGREVVFVDYDRERDLLFVAPFDVDAPRRRPRLRVRAEATAAGETTGKPPPESAEEAAESSVERAKAAR